MLKRKMNYKKSELPIFIQHLKEQRELERAIVGRGKYEFRDEYKHLEISEDKWLRMTRQERHTSSETLEFASKFYRQ